MSSPPSLPHAPRPHLTHAPSTSGNGGLFDNDSLLNALLSVPVPASSSRATSGIQIARRALKQLLGHVESGSLKWDTRITLSIEHCLGCECDTPRLFHFIFIAFEELISLHFCNV